MLLPPPFPLLQVSARHHGGRGSGATIEQVTDDVAGVNSSTIGRFCLDTVPPRRCSFPTSDEPARLHDTAQQYASEKNFRDDGETNGPKTIAQRLNEGRDLTCWMTGYQQTTQFEYIGARGDGEGSPQYYQVEDGKGGWMTLRDLFKIPATDLARDSAKFLLPTSDKPRSLHNAKPLFYHDAHLGTMLVSIAAFYFYMMGLDCLVSAVSGGTTIMIMSDALCGSSISYSPLSFITSRTLTTAPPFRTSPEEMAAVWAGRRERGVCGRV